LQDPTDEYDVSSLEIVNIDSYGMVGIETEVRKLMSGQTWMPKILIFNLTGGTETMTIEAYRLAKLCGAPFC